MPIGLENPTWEDRRMSSSGRRARREGLLLALTSRIVTQYVRSGNYSMLLLLLLLLLLALALLAVVGRPSRHRGREW